MYVACSTTVAIACATLAYNRLGRFSTNRAASRSVNARGADADVFAEAQPRAVRERSSDLEGITPRAQNLATKT